MRCRLWPLLLLLPLGSDAHFMWLRVHDGHAVVVFSENPVKPGLAMFIKSVANRTRLAVAVAPDTTAMNVSLAEQSVGLGGGELVTSLPAAALTSPSNIEGQALWGLFAEMGPKTLLRASIEERTRNSGSLHIHALPRPADVPIRPCFEQSTGFLRLISPPRTTGFSWIRPLRTG